jgi:hypothetical protein
VCVPSTLAFLTYLAVPADMWGGEAAYRRALGEYYLPPWALVAAATGALAALAMAEAVLTSLQLRGCGCCRQRPALPGLMELPLPAAAEPALVVARPAHGGKATIAGPNGFGAVHKAPGGKGKGRGRDFFWPSSNSSYRYQALVGDDAYSNGNSNGAGSGSSSRRGSARWGRSYGTADAPASSSSSSGRAPVPLSARGSSYLAARAGDAAQPASVMGDVSHRYCGLGAEASPALRAAAALGSGLWTALGLVSFTGWLFLISNEMAGRAASGQPLLH